MDKHKNYGMCYTASQNIIWANVPQCFHDALEKWKSNDTSTNAAEATHCTHSVEASGAWFNELLHQVSACEDTSQYVSHYADNMITNCTHVHTKFNTYTQYSVNTLWFLLKRTRYTSAAIWQYWSIYHLLTIILLFLSRCLDSYSNWLIVVIFVWFDLSISFWFTLDPNVTNSCLLMRWCC